MRAEGERNKRKPRRLKARNQPKSKMKEELRKRMRQRSESEGSHEPPKPKMLQKEISKEAKQGGDFSKKMGKLYRKKKRKLEKRKRMGGDGSSIYEKESSRSRPKRIHRGRRMGSEVSQDKSESDLTWASGMYRTMDREMMAEWDQKQARKSPLTNKAPGSQYQKLLKRKKRRRERKEKERSIALAGGESIDISARRESENTLPVSFTSEFAGPNLTESLDVNAHREYFQNMGIDPSNAPGKSNLDQISERERKVEGSSKYPSQRNSEIELKRTLKELEERGGLSREIAALLGPDSRKSNLDPSKLQDVYKSHNLGRTKDVRVKAVVKTGKRMKQYQMNKEKDLESVMVEHSLDMDAGNQKSFAQIYKRKKKKGRRKLKERQTVISGELEMEEMGQLEFGGEEVEEAVIIREGEIKQHISTQNIQMERDNIAEYNAEETVEDTAKPETREDPTHIEISQNIIKQQDETPDYENIKNPDIDVKNYQSGSSLKNQNEQFKLEHNKPEENQDRVSEKITREPQTKENTVQIDFIDRNVESKNVKKQNSNQPPNTEHTKISQGKAIIKTHTPNTPKPESHKHIPNTPKPQIYKPQSSKITHFSKISKSSKNSKNSKVTETVRKRTRKTTKKNQINFVELNKSKTKLAQQALRLKKENEEQERLEREKEENRKKEIEERRKRNLKRREKKDFIKQNLKIKKRRIKKEVEPQSYDYGLEKNYESVKLVAEILAEDNYKSSPRLGDIGKMMYEARESNWGCNQMKDSEARRVSVEKIDDVMRSVRRKEGRVKERMRLLKDEERRQSEIPPYEEPLITDQVQDEAVEPQTPEVPFKVLRLEDFEKESDLTPNPKPFNLQLKNTQIKEPSQTPKYQKPTNAQNKITKSEQEIPKMTKTHSLNWQNFYDGTMKLGPKTQIQRKSSAKLIIKGKVEIDPSLMNKFKKDKKRNPKITEGKGKHKKMGVKAKIDTGIKRRGTQIKKKSRKTSRVLTEVPKSQPRSGAMTPKSGKKERLNIPSYHPKKKPSNRLKKPEIMKKEKSPKSQKSQGADLLIPKLDSNKNLQSLESSKMKSRTDQHQGSYLSSSKPQSKPKIQIKKTKIKKDSNRKIDRNSQKKMTLSQLSPRGRSDYGNPQSLRLADLSPSKIEQSILQKVEGRGIKVSSARRYTDRKAKDKKTEWRLEIADILRTEPSKNQKRIRKKDEPKKKIQKNEIINPKQTRVVTKEKKTNYEKQNKFENVKIQFGDLKKKNVLIQNIEKEEQKPPIQKELQPPHPEQKTEHKKIFNKKKEPTSQKIQTKIEPDGDKITKLYEQKYQIKKSEKVAKSINSQIKRVNRKKFEKSQSVKGLIESEILQPEEVDPNNYKSVQISAQTDNEFKKIMRQKRSQKTIRVDRSHQIGTQVKINNIDQSSLNSKSFLKNSAQTQNSKILNSGLTKKSVQTEPLRGRTARNNAKDKQEEIDNCETDAKKVNFLERNKVAITKGNFKKKPQKRDPMYLPPIKKRGAQSVAVNQSLQWGRAGVLANRAKDTRDDPHTRKRRGNSLNRKRAKHSKKVTISNRTSIRNIKNIKEIAKQTPKKETKIRGRDRIKRIIKEREGKGISHLERVIKEKSKDQLAKNIKKQKEDRKLQAKIKEEEKQNREKEFENLKTQFEQKVFENNNKSSRRIIKVKDDIAMGVKRSGLSNRSGSVAVKRGKPVKINFIQRNKMLARKRAEEVKRKKEEKERREKQKEEKKKLFSSQVLNEIRRESLERKNSLNQSKEEVKGIEDSDLVDVVGTHDEEVVQIEIGDDEELEGLDLPRIEENKQESEDKVELKEEASCERDTDENPSHQQITDIQIQELRSEPIALPENEDKQNHPKPEELLDEIEIERKRKREEIRSRLLRRGKMSTSLSVSNNSQIEIDMIKDRYLGWNSTKRTENVIYKEKKKYVNPVALKPKKKPPTKELDISEIIKNNELMEMTKRGKSESQSAIKEEKTEDKFGDLVTPITNTENKEKVEKDNTDMDTPQIKKKTESKQDKKLNKETEKLAEKEQTPISESTKKEVKIIKEHPAPNPKDTTKQTEDMIESKIISKKRQSEMKRQEIRNILISEELKPQSSILIKEEENIRIQGLLEWSWQEEVTISEPEIKEKESSKLNDNENKPITKQESSVNIQNNETPNLQNSQEPFETQNESKSESERNIGIVEEMKLIRQKIEENREELRKQMVEGSSELLKVKNIEKFRKQGKQKRQKGNRENQLGYPVYKKTESKKKKEIQKEKIEEVTPQPKLNKFSAKERKQKKFLEEEVKETPQTDSPQMGTQDLKEICRDIIKQEIGDKTDSFKTDESDKEISIDEVIVSETKDKDSEMEDEEEEEEEEDRGKTQEILAMLDGSPEKPNSQNKEEEKTLTDPPQLGGYYSRYQSKKAKIPHSVIRKEKNTKKTNKVKRFSSRQIKKRGYFALGMDSKNRERTQSKGSITDEKSLDKTPILKDENQTMVFRGRDAIKPGEMIRMNEDVYSQSDEEPRRGRAEMASSDDEATHDQVVKRRKRRNSLQKKVLAQRKRQYSLQPQISARLEQGNKKLLRPLVKKELMTSNLRGSTPATQAKMRQSILNNLEKLKKITPILKKAQAEKERQEKADNLIQRMKARMSIPAGRLMHRGRGLNESYDSQMSNDDFEEIEKQLMQNLRLEDGRESDVKRDAKGTRKKISDESADQNVVDQLVKVAGLKKSKKSTKHLNKKKPKKRSQARPINNSKNRNFTGKRVKKSQQQSATRKKAKTRITRKKKTLMRRQSLKEDRKMLIQAEQAALDLTQNILKLREEMEISQFQTEAPEDNENVEKIETRKSKNPKIKKTKDKKKLKSQKKNHSGIRGNTRKIKSQSNNEIPQIPTESQRKVKISEKGDVKKRPKKTKKHRIKRKNKPISQKDIQSPMSKTMDLNKHVRDLATDQIEEENNDSKTGKYKKVEKTRMSLQWRKERISAYGRVKSRAKLKTKANDDSKPDPNPGKIIKKVQIETEKKIVKQPKIINIKISEVEQLKPKDSQTAIRTESPSDLRKRDIQKINSRFWKESLNTSASPSISKKTQFINKSCIPDPQSPIRSMNISSRNQSKSRKERDRIKNISTQRYTQSHQNHTLMEKPPVDWKIESALGESNASIGNNEKSMGQLDFPSNSNHPPLTIGTGGQALAQHPPNQNPNQQPKPKLEPEEDSHFQNLMARNANVQSNISINKSEIRPGDVSSSPHGKVRSRLRTLKKTDSKKERDLNRLKKFKERLRQQGNSPILANVNLKPRGTFHGSRQTPQIPPRSSLHHNRMPFNNDHLARNTRLEKPFRESSPVDLIIQNIVSNTPGLKDTEPHTHSASDYRNFVHEPRIRNFEPNRLTPNQGVWGAISTSPDILRVNKTEEPHISGLSSDIMIQNKIIMDDGHGQPKIGTIPEFDEGDLRPISGEKAKKRYRKDRVRELGQRLKQHSSRQSKGSLDINKFLDNI